MTIKDYFDSKEDSSVHSPTSTRTEVRSPTSTRTEVRSPTKTSTEAETTGNITVTGGAGRGAYTNVNVLPNKPNNYDERQNTINMFTPKYDTPPYRFNSFDPDFLMNGGSPVDSYNDFDPDFFVDNKGEIIPDSLFGIAIGKKAKARQAEKKAGKHEYKLAKMDKRTERRDLSNMARTRVGAKKADNEAAKIQLEHEEEMARIAKETPMGNEIPTTPISQTPMTNTGSGGGAYSQPDYSTYMDSETQGNTGIEQNADKTSPNPDPVNPGGTGIILPEATVKAKYPKKKNNTVLILFGIIIIIVAIVYFYPKLLKGK